MLFSTTIFLFLFLPVVLAIYYNPLVKNRTFRNVFLLLVSIGFYAEDEGSLELDYSLSIYNSADNSIVEELENDEENVNRNRFTQNLLKYGNPPKNVL